MPKFEDKFVHFRWSDELKGKKVFYADDICYLERYVISNSHRDIVVSDGLQLQPFVVKHDDGIVRPWRFVYYDPNYETKLAYEQGEKIEFKIKGDAGDDWNYTPDPVWLDDYEYRIMPEEKPVTNRELAMWLVQGNGEYSHRSGEIAYFSYVYRKGEEDAPIENTIRIRKWEDEEWHEPTREYLGL